MGKSLDEVKVLKRDLKKNVFCNPPYDTYVNGVGISTLGIGSKLEKIILEPGEDWDDYCLTVYLKEKPPISFPREYKGVRIVYNIIGEIKAY